MRRTTAFIRAIILTALIFGSLIAYNSITTPPNREGPFSLVPLAYATIDSNLQTDTLKAYILAGDTLPFTIIAGDTIWIQIADSVNTKVTGTLTVSPGDTFTSVIASWPSIINMLQYNNYGLTGELVGKFARRYNTSRDSIYTLAATDTGYVVVNIANFIDEGYVASSASTNYIYFWVNALSDSGDIYLDVAYDYKLLASSAIAWGAPGSATELEDSLTTESTLTAYSVPIDTLVQQVRLVFTALDSCADYTEISVFAAAWRRQPDAAFVHTTYKYEEGAAVPGWSNTTKW